MSDSFEPTDGSSQGSGFGDAASFPDPTPALPHLATEFFAWLWYASERDGGTFVLPGTEGVFLFWVDDRLSFRLPDEDKARAVLTGESAAATLEARAALAGGKVVRDLRLALKREEREYSVTLRGVHLDLQGAKLPAELGAKDETSEVLYERMFLLDELWFMVGALYRRFAAERTSDDWRSAHLAAMRRWAGGLDDA
ncbi:MAG: hypothetical protein H6742_21195 [Alphaproteobacteria bacterium]|nr:hypothetical protein [Alphaproteobacteria bacterium]